MQAHCQSPTGQYCGIDIWRATFEPVNKKNYYYRIKNITLIEGIGLSAGINEHFLAKSDVNLYLINGIAGSFRFALGYKRNGVWSPAGYLTLTSIFGSRTEFLLEDGSRPETPVFSIGLQFSLLRFENENGFVSILDIGYGPGNYHGKNMEASLLTVGIRF